MRFFFASIVSLLLICCSSRHTDARLDRIAKLSESSPIEALDSLAAIDRNALPDRDRHYHDLLTLRAGNKAHIIYQKDSLVLDVIDYYSSHDKNLYPEALYYGGCAYSDFGDFPTAQKYFQKALDLLPDNTATDEIRGYILHEYAIILIRLRLYDEAIPTIKSALKINKQHKDTLNFIYNLQSLGDIYLRTNRNELAEQTFKKALLFSKNQLDHCTTNSLIYLASTKWKLGQVDSALYYIRNVPDIVNPHGRSMAMSHAAMIYYNIGMLDTAYYYSQKIIHGNATLSKLVGYQVILSPRLIHKVPLDTLGKYIWDYRKILEKNFDTNQSQLVINQQNAYNYKFHERDKYKAEKSNESLKSFITIALLTIAFMLIIILYMKIKGKNNIIALHEALDTIREVRDKNGSHESSSIQTKTEHQDKNNISPKPSKDKELDLREKMKNELMNLYEVSDKTITIPSIILQSSVYQKLQEFILVKPTIIDEGKDGIWSELEETILQSSPDFKTHLNLLTQGKLSLYEYHTILLIKCGIKPGQIARLIGRSKTTIGSRRDSISLKILDKKIEPKVIDALIRLL